MPRGDTPRGGFFIDEKRIKNLNKKVIKTVDFCCAAVYDIIVFGQRLYGVCYVACKSRRGIFR
ncbi:MAG TPA: hypothetical protein DEV87_05010 [Clostridiales bacterium]|nr:hypothetical protein [Clostridiales bacterium]